MEDTLKQELGPSLLEELIEQQKTSFEFEGRDDVLTNPVCMTEALKAAQERGNVNQTVAQIVKCIVNVSTGV